MYTNKLSTLDSICSQSVFLLGMRSQVVWHSKKICGYSIVQSFEHIVTYILACILSVSLIYVWNKVKISHHVQMDSVQMVCIALLTYFSLYEFRYCIAFVIFNLLQAGISSSAVFFNCTARTVCSFEYLSWLYTHSAKDCLFNCPFIKQLQWSNYHWFAKLRVVCL
jgi:hypothetical protein